MTPRQRRNHIEALGIAASAPRKSWLGKSMLLTSIQSAWIKSLLTTWGDGVSGGTAPRLPRAHACWDVLKGARWSDKALSRFTAALEQARAEGFRGRRRLIALTPFCGHSPPPASLMKLCTMMTLILSSSQCCRRLM